MINDDNMIFMLNDYPQDLKIFFHQFGNKDSSHNVMTV